MKKGPLKFGSKSGTGYTRKGFSEHQTKSPGVFRSPNKLNNEDLIKLEKKELSMLDTGDELDMKPIQATKTFEEVQGEVKAEKAAADAKKYSDQTVDGPSKRTKRLQAAKERREAKGKKFRRQAALDKSKVIDSMTPEEKTSYRIAKANKAAEWVSKTLAGESTSGLRVDPSDYKMANREKFGSVGDYKKNRSGNNKVKQSKKVADTNKNNDIASQMPTGFATKEKAAAYQAELDAKYPMPGTPEWDAKYPSATTNTDPNVTGTPGGEYGTFDETFAAARAAGKKEFDWAGEKTGGEVRKFHTGTAEEGAPTVYKMKRNRKK